MSRIAYLTMDSLDDFECYDHLTVKPLTRLGHGVDTVSWRAANDWDAYDVVVIRSPWDYQQDATAFLACLEAIDRSTAVLQNPLDVVRWNIDKRYLRDLESRGTAIVPTLWPARVDAAALEEAFDSFAVKEVIAKPAVSANADDTFRVPAGGVGSFIGEHAARFDGRQALLQPFLTSVVDEGEFSLFYFAGDLSHCILKTPADEDFRVQEEHGGRLRRVANPEPALVAAGEQTLAAIGTQLLYARLDFVRHEGAFLLMEAELIEPSLYFNLDPDSPARFARCLDGWLRDDPES